MSTRGTPSRDCIVSTNNTFENNMDHVSFPFSWTTIIQYQNWCMSTRQLGPQLLHLVFMVVRCACVSASRCNLYGKPIGLIGRLILGRPTSMLRVQKIPGKGRFVGIFLPHFYLTSGANGEVLSRRLSNEPEFAKKARDQCVQSCGSHPFM